MLCGELRFCFESASGWILRVSLLSDVKSCFTAKMFLSIYRTVSELEICFTVHPHSNNLFFFLIFDENIILQIISSFCVHAYQSINSLLTTNIYP